MSAKITLTEVERVSVWNGLHLAATQYEADAMQLRRPLRADERPREPVDEQMRAQLAAQLEAQGVEARRLAELIMDTEGDDATV